MWTICPNRASCPGQLFQAVKHFVHRGAMDIDGFGEKQAERFLGEGLIRSVADIYALTAGNLQSLDGFGAVSAANLIEAIERSRERPFQRVLFALGVPGIGYVNARALAAEFGSIDALMAADAEAIERTPGIGPVLADTIASTLAEERTRELIERLRAHGLQMAQAPGSAEPAGPLAGRTLVVTGTLPTLSREDATGRIEAAGGKVTGSVSGNTDFLVAGEDPGSKLTRAEKLGTDVIDEARLLELLSGGVEGVQPPSVR